MDFFNQMSRNLFACLESRSDRIVNFEPFSFAPKARLSRDALRMNTESYLLCCVVVCLTPNDKENFLFVS